MHPLHTYTQLYQLDFLFFPSKCVFLNFENYHRKDSICWRQNRSRSNHQMNFLIYFKHLILRFFTTNFPNYIIQTKLNLKEITNNEIERKFIKLTKRQVRCCEMILKTFNLSSLNTANQAMKYFVSLWIQHSGRVNIYLFSKLNVIIS